MNLTDYYKRQFGWRDWPRLFDALPPLAGKTVLDLGCGIGDQTAELTARGAQVIGFDIGKEVLEAAKSRGLANAEFRQGDLRGPLNVAGEVDGVWSSFSAAYFPDFIAVLVEWVRPLRPGGWIALTEIDDFFGHEPLSAASKSIFEGYAREALAAGRYDFHMGRKLRTHLEIAGLTVSTTFTVEDQELSFDGPARLDVLHAWQTRLEGMKLLRDFCSGHFENVRDEFLACLARPDHRSTAKVVCCIATK